MTGDLELAPDRYSDRYWMLTRRGRVLRRGRGWWWGRLWLAFYRLRPPQEDP